MRKFIKLYFPILETLNESLSRPFIIIIHTCMSLTVSFTIVNHFDLLLICHQKTREGRKSSKL